MSMPNLMMYLTGVGLTDLACKKWVGLEEMKYS